MSSSIYPHAGTKSERAELATRETIADAAISDRLENAAGSDSSPPSTRRSLLGPPTDEELLDPLAAGATDNGPPPSFVLVVMRPCAVDHLRLSLPRQQRWLHRPAGDAQCAPGCRPGAVAVLADAGALTAESARKVSMLEWETLEVNP